MLFFSVKLKASIGVDLPFRVSSLLHNTTGTKHGVGFFSVAMKSLPGREAMATIHNHCSRNSRVDSLSNKT
jgi:hypothetical protein